MRKGSQKYIEMLEEFLNPPKKLPVKNRILSIEEQDRAMGREPMMDAQIEDVIAMWKKFDEEREKRKDLEKKNKTFGSFSMYGNGFMSAEIVANENPQENLGEDSQSDFLKLPSALSIMNEILKKQ